MQLQLAHSADSDYQHGALISFHRMLLQHGHAYSCMMLTGAIQSAKQGVEDFSRSFDQFSFLWMKDLAAEYSAFLATNPNLEVLS